jgi:hypothetical protein
LVEWLLESSCPDLKLLSLDEQWAVQQAKRSGCVERYQERSGLTR